MITHVSYCEERYRSAAECIEGIRRRLEHGWWLNGLSGPLKGLYVATFGVSDEQPEVRG